MASSSTQPSGNGLTLKPVMTLEGHEPWHCDSSDSQDAEYDPVSSISYFPDGKQIVSGSSDKTIRRWDLREGREIEKARDVCKDDVRIVEVSRSGRWVVTVNEWELKVSEVETGIVRTFHEDIGIIDISADSTLLAGASPNSIVRIWDLNTGELVAGPFKLLDDYPISMGLRLSDDSRKLAGISLYLKKPGLYLQVWDVQAQKLDIQKSTPYNVNYISPVPVFWTTNNKSIVAAFTDDADDPRATTTRTIYEFDASTLKIVGAPFKGHTRVITGLALSPDCVLLVSSSYDNTIKLWSFESRQLLASFDVKSPRNLVLSPVSCQLAYTTWHETKIYICNIPANILASIGLAEELQLSTSKSKDATPRLVRRKPVIPLMYPISRPLGARDPQISRRHFLRKLLPSSFRTDTVPTDDPRDLLHFPVTSPLPRPLLDSDPSILASIQPVPQVRTSHGAPRNLAQLGPDLELLHSSSHTHTLSFTSNGEHGDLPPEATLQDLSEYIIKDGDYPVTRGGFGEIWKCTFDIGSICLKFIIWQVAVKALQVYADDQVGAAKTKKINRVKRELMICANLHHANILPVYGYTTGFGPFIAIVSPWAENGNLTTYLKREHANMTVLRRFEILRDIMAGLQYLHANSVIHGDFSGPNVLIRGDGSACISDFGLSLMYSEIISASQASWTSTLKGNMRWMAPERLVLEREDGSPTRPSEQSDIFSFGGVMLQVLTNKIPYYYLLNDAAIVLCIARSEKPYRDRYPELPEKYWTFIEECWSPDPWDRPSTRGADAVIRKEFYSLSKSR